ncbi:MAG: hypothetical protein AB7F40_06170 [Victivallaceae bacterium]|nr:hypothetical protein [Victivallaceae bacterium]
MKPFWTIVKLTMRNAFRSHIFQLLLAILILCVVFIPATIEGDGTARGFIQVSLKYSLFAVALMLSLSSVWSGCQAMTQDVDGYQLHMVVSKPVSRVVIWMAKLSGIFIIHVSLLLISAVLIYAVVMTRYNAQQISDSDVKQVEADVSSLEKRVESMPNTRERDAVKQRLEEQKDVLSKMKERIAEDTRIRNEVLVARRKFMPVGAITMPDGTKKDMPISSPEYIAYRSQADFEAWMRDNQIEGNKLDASSQRARLKDIKVAAITAESSVQFGPDHRKIWRISDLPTGDNPLFVRYRTFVTEVSDTTERMTLGQWFYGRVIPGPDNTTVASDTSWIPLSVDPQSFLTNRFSEFKLPNDAIDSYGTVLLSFINYDPQKQEMFFQIWDGPEVYARYGGFTANYVKCVLMIALELLVLSALGCAVSAFLSMPTAIFFVISYLFAGSLATAVSSRGYIITDDATLAAQARLGSMVGKLLLLLVIPLQDFDVSDLVADGIMIEWSSIADVVLNFCVLRVLPLCLLGVWLYRRRELGLVIRK